MTAATYQSVGTAGAGLTTVTAAKDPSGLSVSDGLLIYVTWHDDTTGGAGTHPIACSTPSHGLTKLVETVGTGPILTTDNGRTSGAIFFREIDGTEPSSYTFNAPINGGAQAQCVRVSKASGYVWDVLGVGGEDTGSDTAVSAVLGTIALMPDDLCLGVVVKPTDGGAAGVGGFSAEGISGSGLTFGSATEIAELVTAVGFDQIAVLFRQTVATGTGSVAPTMTATIGGTGKPTVAMLARMRIVQNPPGIPTTVTATPDTDEITLTWAAPSTGGTVTGYDVQLDSGTITDVGNVLTHTFTGLTPDTSYTVKVRAHGAGGNSSFVPLTLDTLGPPDVPTDVDATATSTTTITLTWDPPSGPDPVDHYEVRIDGGSPVDVGTLETHGFTGLTPATEYTVEVRAVNDAGESSWVPVTLETLAPAPVDVYLRLEVEEDPPAGKIRNLLANPNGELGGVGWVTPKEDSTIAAEGSGIRFVSGGFGDISGAFTWFASEAFAVTPGEFLSGRFRVTGGVVSSGDPYWRAWIAFDGQPSGEFAGAWPLREITMPPTALGTYIAGTQEIPLMPAAFGTDQESDPMEVPADMVRARIMVRFETSTFIIPPAGGTLDFDHAGVVVQPTDAPVDWSDVVEVADLDWLDVLGPTHEIEVDRAALDLGTLTATILDATLDPASAETLATGRGCRLTALSAMTGEWDELFTGRIDQAKVNYDTRRQAINPDDPKTARITLTAHDATTQLAASPRPDGYGTVDELRAVLEGTGVPWNINGETGQISDAVVVSRNENASAVDQIAITRDSAAAYAWLDRYGVLQAWNRDELVDGPAVVLDEDRYSDLSLSYDSEAFINSVVVTYLTYDPATGETVETKYGPYVDARSFGSRGEKRAEFTVHGLVPAGTDPVTAVADFAQAVLDANGVAVRTCESVTIPIRNSGEVTTSRAFLDMYRLTRVVNTSRGFDEDLRVTGVTHRISADPKRRRAKWNATYTFAPLGSVASPQVTPPIPARVANEFTAPSFTNGWVDYGSGVRPAGYRKLGGIVELRGAVKNGTVGTQILQLPEGFRPADSESFPVVASGDTVARLNVNEDGSVVPVAGAGNAYVYLSGVRFQADA